MEASLPKIRIHGEGAIRYRCAACGELIEGSPVWIDEGTPEAKTYHAEHVPVTHGA